MKEPTLNPETEREFDEEFFFQKDATPKKLKHFIAKVEQRVRDEERKKIKKWGKMLKGGSNEWLVEDLIETLKKE